LTENDTGIITRTNDVENNPPLTLSLTVQASAVTSVTASEGPSSSLTVDPVTRLVFTQINFTPVLNGNQVPQSVTYWISTDNGTTATYIGWTDDLRWPDLHAHAALHPKHWTKALLHASVILFDGIVQVFAAANPNSLRQFASALQNQQPRGVKQHKHRGCFAGMP
jgi:hypothetical protein